MNSFEVSTNNTIVLQKDIFRLAAAIYSENSDSVYESEIQEQIIECMFTSTGNEYFTISEIISSVLEIYKYHISEDEVERIIKNTRGKFQQVTKDGCKAYSLTQQAYDEAETLQKNNIDSYIDLFIKERNINDPEKCKNAIHVYLYELTTTNINSYRVLLEGKDGTQFTSDELSVDVSDLNDIEKSLVHDFLSWNNPEKNAALGNLVFCCLEYCLLINGDTPNNLLKRYIKTRDIYLDTNIIFRALGINGESRKKVILAFIKKCKQASIKLYITHNTRKEFFDTINYYVNQMQHLKKGTIFPGAYDQITDYNIFSFYEEWYRNHANTSLKYFITYINSQYMEFVKEFCIEDDAMIPASIYNSSIFKAERNNYSASIKNVKQKINDDYTPEDYRYTQRDSHDATVVRYIELLRIKTNAKDIFLVSSDKALRLWDMNRTNSIYPVVIYPSQLFLILLKTCGRSENDYDCFVNFINIRPTSKQVSPENAHAIISGISSITEDIKTQKYLVASVFGEEFQNVIRNSSSDIELYEKVQTITQNYLEEQLKEKENVIKTLQDDIARQGENAEKMHSTIISQDTDLTESKRQIANKEKELEKQKQQINSHARNKTRLPYVWLNYCVPALLVIITISFGVFVFLQFFYKEKNWNYSVMFFEWIRHTYFGKNVGEFVYSIDLFVGSVIIIMIKKWIRNPFNKSQREQLKEKLANKYISDNNLS